MLAPITRLDTVLSIPFNGFGPAAVIGAGAGAIAFQFHLMDSARGIRFIVLKHFADIFMFSLVAGGLNGSAFP